MALKLFAKVVPREVTGDWFYLSVVLLTGADVAEAGVCWLSLSFLTGAAHRAL